MVAHEAVMKLSSGLDYLGHCITKDNYFTSIPLFKELTSKGIYAMGIVKSNCIGLPSYFKNTRNGRNMVTWNGPCMRTGEFHVSCGKTNALSFYCLHMPQQFVPLVRLETRYQEGMVLCVRKFSPHQCLWSTSST